jgi:hypothetical protein
MAATGEPKTLAVRNPVTKLSQTAFGHKKIAITREDERGHVDSLETARDVELLDQAEAVGHDALIGLPALLGDELEQGARLLARAKKQIEKLIDEGIVGRQWIAGKHDPGHLLKQAALEAASRSLHR